MTDELTKGAPEGQNPPKPGMHPFHDPAYPDHKAFPGLPSHFSLLSAQATGTPHNGAAHSSLAQDLIAQGYDPIPVKGHYGAPEESYLVPHKGTPEDHKKIEETGWKFGQDAVLHSSEKKNKLIFRNGGPEWKGEGVTHGPHLHSYYTQLPSGHRFQLSVNEPSQKVAKSDEPKPYEILDEAKKDQDKQVSHPHHYGVILGVNVFHATHDSHEALPGLHLKDPDDKQTEEAIEEALKEKHPSIVIHGNPPSMLREDGPSGAHPHAYDWHEGHTDFNGDEETDDVTKHDEHISANTAKPQPALEHHSGNAQAAGKGVSTYKPIAEHYGSITPGHKSNLQFYRGVEKHEPEIDKEISKQGYQTFYAGGKHGRPDLKNKNYNTGHLMVWDPTPGSGGDFKDEAFTRSWKKVHELSHAMTYKDVNSLYGEGRRLGKMGVRSPREAKRAVHWEWLAAHKQRELTEKMGHKISDTDFHQELNTIMHDAVHRALTGQFTEPSDEGFIPSKEHLPLEHSLRLIDEHAKKSGLEHEESTFRTTGTPADESEGFKQMIKTEQEEPIMADNKDIGERLKKLQVQLKEHVETIQGPDLAKGIESPETDCAACERSVQTCVCYMNLPAPRVEVSEKGVSIFFKSEWSEEDTANFKNDLIKRAGIVLKQRRLDKAKDTLSKIRKGIK